MLTICLINPQIPPNTGNIARLCAANYCALHLVGPLGFSLDDSHLKRAGLDYWEHVDVTHFPDTEAYLAAQDPEHLHLFSTKANKYYTEAQFQAKDTLIFGSETQGLSAPIRERFSDSCLKLPMQNPNIRSLNLATAVAIPLFEALRQINDAHTPES